jgi:hypothetical protein
MTAIDAGPARRPITLSPTSLWKATGAFFFVALALVFGAFSVGRKVNVDENVFIASAALFSKHLMLYRDYHYNHMPTLVILYALLFKMTGYFLLAARSVSAICAAGIAAIVFHVAYQSLAFLNPRRRLWMAIGVGVMILVNPLFTRTAGRSWNHDFPAFFSLLGFLAISRGLQSRSLGLLAASGLAVGIAVTTRLTFATELLPFVVFVLIYPNISLARRAGLLAAFAVGCLLAMLPSIWVWAQSPVNAYFGNFQYPAFNTKWHWIHDDLAHHRDTILAKIGFFILNTCLAMPGNGIVAGGFVVLSVIALRRRLGSEFQAQLLTLILLAASQLAAGLVPSPPFVQYYFAATPFMLLGVILCLANIPDLAADRRRDWIWITCLAISLPFGIVEYRDLPRLFWIPSWWPVQAHEVGEQIARLTGPAEVLTLDPIYVLEGGLDIYPATATGCFGMRVGDYLTPAQRSEFKMWGTDEVKNLFETDPPKAVMISPGSDGDIEALFTRLAQSHGYRRVDVKAKNPAIILWVKSRAVSARSPGAPGLSMAY